MPNISQMNIGIGTKLGALDKGLSQAQKKISSFASGVDKRLGNISTQRLEKGLQNIGAKGVPSANKLVSSLDMVEGQLQQTAKASRSVGGVSHGLQRAFGQGRSQIRQTSAAVVNFNRVIQDAPFGIIGVANNLEPLATSFQSLKGQIGSTSGALMHLAKSAFTGPGALITAVSLASSALLFFQMKMRGAGGASKETKERIEGVIEAAEDLNKVLNQDTGFADQIERDIQRNKEAIQLAKERRNLREQLIKQAAQGGEFEVSIPELEEEIDAVNELINVLGFEETALEDLESNLRKLEKQQEIYNGTVGTSETRMAAFVDQLEGEAQKAIDNYQAGITQTTDGIEEQRSKVGQLLRSFQQLARQGNEDARKAAIVLKEVWNDLNGELDDTAAKAPQVDMSFQDWDESASGASESIKDLGVNLDKMPDMEINDEGLKPAMGSLADLQMRLSAFQNMRAVLDPASQGFQMLTEKINLTEQQINELEGAVEGVEDSAEGTAGAINLLGNALTRAVVQGKELDSIFSSIARQLAGKAILTALQFLIPGGGATIGETGFFGKLFSFHSGGVVPGPMGQERLALVQGGETIRTPRQERNLGRGRTQKIVVPVNVDGRQIAIATAEYENNLSR